MKKALLSVLVVLLLAGLVLSCAPASAEKSILLTFTGDCTIGNEERMRRDPESFTAVVRKEGYAYPFAKFLPLFEQDDCTVVNFEGVFSDSKEDEKKEKTYRFRGDTDLAAVLLQPVQQPYQRLRQAGDPVNYGYADSQQHRLVPRPDALDL